MNFAGRKVYIGKEIAEEVISRADLADSVEALSRRELSMAARRRKAGGSMRTHKLKRRTRPPRPSPMPTIASAPESATLAADGAISASDSDDEGAVRERISTNVVAVDLESVRDPAPLGGDAGTVILRCPNPRCGSFFSSLSELTGTTWVCEYCACSVGIPADLDPASIAGAKIVANDAAEPDGDGDASPGPELDEVPSDEPELDTNPVASGAGGGDAVLDPIEVAGETSVAEFILSDPASEAAAAAAAGDDDTGVSTTGIVFVCDISGSMRATSKAPRGYKREDGAEAERKAEESARETLTAAGLSAEEISQQLAAMRSSMASASRSGGVYISRLEGLQQAIRSQVGDLAKGTPARPVALVTFCNDVGVHVISGQSTLTGATLKDYKALLEAGKVLADTHAKPVASCSEDIASIVKRFEPEGGTALGPGTMVGIGIASKMGAGSRVMVVTDGVANTGVGCLSPTDPDFSGLAEAERGSGFYHKAGTIAAELGVVVDVVAISGDGAALEHLGNLAAAANGEIRTVDPASLTAEFDEIVAAEVVATQAEIATVVSSHLAFEDPDFWGWSAFSDSTPAPAPVPVPVPVVDNDDDQISVVSDASDSPVEPPLIVPAVASAVVPASAPVLIEPPGATSHGMPRGAPRSRIAVAESLAAIKPTSSAAGAVSAAVAVPGVEEGAAAAPAVSVPTADGAMGKSVPPLSISPDIVGDGTGPHRIVTGILLAPPRPTGPATGGAATGGAATGAAAGSAPVSGALPDLGETLLPAPLDPDESIFVPIPQGNQPPVVSLGIAHSSLDPSLGEPVNRPYIPIATARTAAARIADVPTAAPTPVSDGLLASGVDGPSRVWRKAGNVMPGSEFTLAFGPRPQPLPEGVKSVPFQMQLWFKRPGDDRRFLRIITQYCPVTAELDEATSAANVVTPVMAAYARQRAAQLAAHGQYRQCRAATHAYGRVLAQNAVILASEDEVERLATPAPIARPTRGGRAIRSKRKEKRSMLSALRSGMAGLRSSITSCESSEDEPEDDGDEVGMAARLERIGSGDGPEEGRAASGELAMYGSWLSGMAGLDNAIRAEMKSETAEGLALEDDDFMDEMSSGPLRSAMPRSMGASVFAAGAPPAPSSASLSEPMAAFGMTSLSSAAPTSGWAGVAERATPAQRAQHAMRSGRRAHNDSLSSAIQGSMRRGVTSRSYAKKRSTPKRSPFEDE